MRVLDIQSALKRSGVIRLGEQATGQGPGRRLSTFRLTSNDRTALEAVGRLYGGQVTTWEKGSQAYQITTKANELPIELSNQETSTQYELWGQVGGQGGKQCLRRCDGCNIVGGHEADNPCRCPGDPVERAAAAKVKGAKVCTLNCRMFVRLPAVPDVGLWQVTTGSFYAAKEVPAIMDGIEMLAKLGAHIRARLAIDIRKSGGKTFPVLCVRLDQSSDQLKELAVSHVEKMRELERSGADDITKLAFKLGMNLADLQPKALGAPEAPALPVIAQTVQDQAEASVDDGQASLGGWND